MARYEISTPNGKYEVAGPEGMSEQQAYAHLQQHLGGGGQQEQQTPGLAKSAASGLIEGAGAPGDLSNRVLGGAPAQQPIDKDTYYGKLVDALNVARKHLELPTTQQIGNTVGMQPTQPVTGAEKIVQGGASMLPGAVMGGAPGAGRAAMGAAPAANAVRAMGLAPAQGAASSSIPQAGNALQSQLLQQGLQHGASAVGHAVGGPLGGMAAKAAAQYIPKVLRFP